MKNILILICLLSFSALADTNKVVIPSLLSTSGTVLMKNAEFVSTHGETVLFKDGNLHLQGFPIGELNTNTVSKLHLDKPKMKREQAQLNEGNQQYRERLKQQIPIVKQQAVAASSLYQKEQKAKVDAEAERNKQEETAEQSVNNDTNSPTTVNGFNGQGNQPRGNNQFQSPNFSGTRIQATMGGRAK